MLKLNKLRINNHKHCRHGLPAMPKTPTFALAKAFPPATEKTSTDINAYHSFHLIYIYNDMRGGIRATSLRGHQHGDEGARKECGGKVWQRHAVLHHLGRFVHA